MQMEIDISIMQQIQEIRLFPFPFSVTWNKSNIKVKLGKGKQKLATEVLLFNKYKLVKLLSSIYLNANAKENSIINH